MKVRKAVIPVAGFGTRFLPVTKATPKEMLPLVDKPLVQYAVEEAAAVGIEQVIFVTGQSKRAIEDHFDRNFELEYLLESKGKVEQHQEVVKVSELVKVAYVRQREMKGLGHAILQARNLVGDEPFLVILPDDICKGSTPASQYMVDTHQATGAPVIGIQEVPWESVHLYGIVAGRNDATGEMKISEAVEKPSPDEAPSRWAQIGRYLLTPDIFPILATLPPGKNNEIQLNDAINLLASARPTYGAKISTKRYDAGDKLGYLKAVVEFAADRPDLGDAFRRYLEEFVGTWEDTAAPPEFLPSSSAVKKYAHR